MSEEKAKNGGGIFKSCIGVFLGLGALGMAAIACVCVIVIGVAVLVASNQEKKQSDIEALNAGGTLDNPVAAGEWLIYDTADIRATEMIRKATPRVMEMNMFNDDPAVGSDYVLVSFEIKCKTGECNMTGSGFWLIDEFGAAWDEVLFLVIDPDLDGEDALAGATLAGWQAFEFPENGTVEKIRIRWDGASLYTVAPPE